MQAQNNKSSKGKANQVHSNMEVKMRKLTIVLSVFTMLCACFAETMVSGEVNGVWDNAHSPYIVTSDISVPTDGFLIIQAGVQVIFQGHHELRIESNAILKAIGTDGEPIVFTADNPDVGHAGIVFNYSSNTCSLSHCRIEYGKALGMVYPYSFGGAIICIASNPTIMECEIENNSAMMGGGGGIACVYSSPIIANNLILNNTSLYPGGGIFCTNSNPQISCNTIKWNSTAGSGGGIFCGENSSPSIINNVIALNVADSVGGALDCNMSSSPNLINNTIVGNQAELSAGAISCSYSSNPVAVNTVFWANTSSDSSEIYLFSIYGYTSGFHLSHCLLDFTKCATETGSEVLNEGGNFIDNPLFFDALYNLSSTSPLIDAGVPIAIHFDDTLAAPSGDFCGRIRPYGTGWDIGAFEFNPNPEMSVSHDEIDFGNVEVSTSVSTVISIQNVGTGELVVYNIYPTDPVFDATENYLVIPEDSIVSVGISFTPEITEIYEDTLWLYSNADTQFVLLGGKGVAPNMVLSLTEMDFGVMMEGTIENATLIVGNTGEMDLYVYGSYVSSDDFNIDESENIIAPGDSYEFEIAFMPEEAREYSETLWIYSNDDTQQVLLNADVWQKPTITLSDSGIDFGTLSVNTSVDVEIVVTNTGGFDLTLERIEVTNSVFTVEESVLPIIAPGASSNFTISANTDVAGEYSGILWFYSEYDTASILLYAICEETGIAEDIDKKHETIQLSVYPNPFNSSISIELNGEILGIPIVKILDMNGRLVIELPRGKNRWYTGNDVSAGMYIVTATVGNEVLRKRVICAK